ncbi:MAG: hypothetical protein KJ626_16375 [Verrucomicrobia bacterium]|nr:hypothetical protein [Verrucomicrobiota bacterium]
MSNTSADANFSKPRFRAGEWGVLFAGALLILIRVPHISFAGRFWAEEGSIHYARAWNSGVGETLLTHRIGYFSLVNKLGAALASRFPLMEYAPLVTVYVALLVQLSVVALLLFSRIRGLDSLWRKTVAVLLSIVVLPCHEIWLTTIGSQFYLCAAAGIILVSEPDRRSVEIFRYSLLAIAGLTGMVSLPLTPLFILSLFFVRKRHRLIEVAILLACCLVQSSIEPCCGNGGVPREPAFHLQLFPLAIACKMLFLPISGVGITDKVGRIMIENQYISIQMATGLLVVTAACILFYLRKVRMWEVYFLLAAAAGMAVVGFCFAVERESSEKMIMHVTGLDAGRYYYASNLFTALAIVLAALKHLRDGRRIAFTAGAVWIAWVLVVAVSDYAVSRNRYAWFFKGPAWAEEVQRWNEDPSRPLRIWPEPWVVELSERE